MAVVHGQAVRRREGVSPNTLVMATHGEPSPSEPRISCPVGRCPATRPADQERSMDLHLALDHPRHAKASEARQRLDSRMWPSAQSY